MTWERRMALKAKYRKDTQDEIERKESQKDWDALQEQYIADYASSLTVEQARAEQKASEENPIGCACIGGPVCCQIRYKARQRVLA